MKAEEFLKDYRTNNRLSIIYNKLSLGQEIAEIMEAYHQHRVNSISDADITKESTISDSDGFTNGFDYGAKWFKEELLKQ